MTEWKKPSQKSESGEIEEIENMGRDKFWEDIGRP